MVKHSAVRKALEEIYSAARRLEKKLGELTDLIELLIDDVEFIESVEELHEEEESAAR